MDKRNIYIFTLKGININEILIKNKYIDKKPIEFVEETHIDIDNDSGDTYVTNITDLLHEKSTRYITIIDPAKNNIKVWITMIDYVRSSFLPISTNMPCWWCRGTFDSSPIGCPIRYYSNLMSDTKKACIKQQLLSANLPTDTTDFFETEGIFCSFPCCKAYILSQKGAHCISGGLKTYKDSCTLLTLMYYKLYGNIVKIKSAASYHLIDTWGGHLTLKEFRDSHCLLTYNITPNIKRPFMCPTGYYVEEKKVFT